MLLYIEACNAGSMFDGILQENTKSMLKYLLLNDLILYTINQIKLL